MRHNSEQNPLALSGLDFIEFAGPDSTFFEQAFKQMGFMEVGQVHGRNIKLYRQGDINFLSNCEPQTFGTNYAKVHGPSVCALGFKVQDSDQALMSAVERGARAYEGGDFQRGPSLIPAIYGVGDSLIYLVDEKSRKKLYDEIFMVRAEDAAVTGKGVGKVDYLTHVIPAGELQKWFDFFVGTFGFADQENSQTSVVLKAPKSEFSVVLKEPHISDTEIQEYLKECKGSGIQHIALLAAEDMDSVQMGPIHFEVSKKGKRLWNK